MDNSDGLSSSVEVDNSDSGGRGSRCKVISNNQRFQCPCCKMEYRASSSRARHMVLKHRKMYKNNGQLVDASEEEIERRQLFRSRELVQKRHVYSITNNRVPVVKFPCPCCKMNFCALSSRSRHMIEKHHKTYDNGQLIDAIDEKVNQYHLYRIKEGEVMQKNCKIYNKCRSFQRSKSPPSISPDSYCAPRKSFRLNSKPRVRYSIQSVDALSDSSEQSTFIEQSVNINENLRNKTSRNRENKIEKQDWGISSNKNPSFTLDTKEVSRRKLSTNANENSTENDNFDVVKGSNCIVRIDKHVATHFDRRENKISQYNDEKIKIISEQMEDANTFSSESMESGHTLTSLEHPLELNVDNRVLADVQNASYEDNMPCNFTSVTDVDCEITDSNTNATSDKFADAFVPFENNIDNHHKNIDSVISLCNRNSHIAEELDHHLEINRDVFALAQTIPRPWTVASILIKATELFPLETIEELTARIIHIISVSHVAVDYLIGYSVDSSNLPGKDVGDCVPAFNIPPITHGVLTDVIDGFLNGSTYVMPVPHRGLERSFKIGRDGKDWTRASHWAIETLENERPPYHAISFKRSAGNDPKENTEMFRLSAISSAIEIFKYVARELTRNLIRMKDDSVGLTPIDASLLTRVRRSKASFDL